MKASVFPVTRRSVTRRSAVRRVGRLAALAALGVTLGLPAVDAMAAWPDRPIRMVVPFPSGGGTDKLARLVSKQVAEANGWTIVVENRAGAEGNIALDAVAKAKADGYTLLFGQLDNLALNPLLFDKLPFDPFNDFRPVALVAESPAVYVVAKDSRIGDFRQAVELSRAAPGTISFGFPSSATRMLVELTQKAGGIKFLSVPYKGAAQALPDLMGGHIQLYVGSTQTLLSHIKAGSVRAVAVTSKARVAPLPDVPTVNEAGLPDFDASNIWWGVAAPAGTPDTVVQQLNAAINQALANPELRRQIEVDGGVILGGSPEAMAKTQRSDYDKLKPIVQETGMKAQ